MSSKYVSVYDSKSKPTPHTYFIDYLVSKQNLV